MALRELARRMLPTTGAAYYGTETFAMPEGWYPGAPMQYAQAPGTVVVYGYDFMCLLKDIRKTNCQDLHVSIWSVMTCLSAMVMIFCIVLIPIACIYRSGRFAGSNLKKMWGGGQKDPFGGKYEEIEERAAKSSDGVMPVPPKVSQYRQGWGPNYQNRKDDEEEEWEE